MRLHLSFCLAALCAFDVQAQSAAELVSQRYSVDPMHSTVAFTTVILGGVKVRGRFTAYDGTVIYDAKHPERSSVSAIIETKSVNTDMSFRDDHLRSPDFLDVEHFPTIEFVSERVVPRRDGLMVSGMLTMHGVSRPVSFPAKLALAPYKIGTTVGVAFSAELRVSRKDYGIAGTNKFNPDYNPLTNMLSDSVDIVLDIDAIRSGYADRRLGTGKPPGVADTINKVVLAHGVDSAIATYHRLRESHATDYNFGAYQLDLLGHQLAERGAIADAIKIFRLNVEQYENTDGVLDSLGEAQASVNDSAGALTTFRRAREKFPKSANAREMVRRLERAQGEPPA
jgi:polyisoprenoid-binding protein YceI